ncbi:PIN domain-containing protein [Patescibacteria group bacterium]
MKEYKYFIDTNIFLRVLVGSDNKFYDESLGFLKKIKAGKMSAVTSDLVLSEINWVLRKQYGFSKENVIEAIKSILYLKNLKIENNTNMAEALLLYQNHKVKFIDALLATGCKNNYTIVSYDKDFDKLGLKRFEPKDLK